MEITNKESMSYKLNTAFELQEYQTNLDNVL